MASSTFRKLIFPSRAFVDSEYGAGSGEARQRAAAKRQRSLQKFSHSNGSVKINNGVQD